jgi:hypothetical protein
MMSERMEKGDEGAGGPVHRVPAVIRSGQDLTEGGGSPMATLGSKKEGRRKGKVEDRAA